VAVEIFTIGVGSLTAALAAGCLTLINLTYKNLRNQTESDTDKSSDDCSTPEIVRNSEETQLQQNSLDLKEIESSGIRGDSSLLRDLSLPSELQPTLLVEGEHLSAMAANVGFTSLELVSREILKKYSDSEPFLFGVNRGGGIIASLLSHRLGLAPKHYVRCDYRPDWRRVICEPRDGVKLAIVVDDAVRSGTTLTAVKSFLNETYPDIKIFVLALVVSIDEQADKDENYFKLFDLVDYYPWISMRRKTRLPWTDKKSNAAEDYFEVEGVRQIFARLLAHKHSAGTDLPGSKEGIPENTQGAAKRASDA
jgi:hypoxanthine phosphoribosyltransferase